MNLLCPRRVYVDAQLSGVQQRNLELALGRQGSGFHLSPAGAVDISMQEVLITAQSQSFGRGQKIYK